MSDPDAYVQEIDSLTVEIKRLTTHLKKLREQRKVSQTHLHNYMVKKGLEKYGGYTRKNVSPKSTKPRKSESEKKTDAIELFRQAGISDPEEFFIEFKATQKYGEDENPPVQKPKPPTKTKKKINSNKEYDPFLGF